MSNIKVISKETHDVLMEVNESKISLSEASVVILKMNKDDVLKIEQNGNNAIITLKSGEQVIIENFFNNVNYETENSLVFEDDQHKLLWVQFSDANGALLDNITYSYIENIEPLLYHDTVAGPLLWSFIPTTAAGILWWAHNDHKNNKEPLIIAKPSTPENFIDNQGDIQGTFSGGTPTDDNTPGIIIGPVAPGETPKLFVDGKEVPSTYDPNTGTLTPNNPLSDGQHDITYTLTDQAGNTSAPSDSIKINIDTTPPAKPPVPEDFFDNHGDIQGTFPGGTPTDDNTPGIIIGPVAPGETPKLFVDGKEVPSTYDPNTGTLTPNNPLSDGQHDITYTLTDQAGNTSAPSDPIEIIVDTTPPAKPSTPENFVDNQGDIQGTFPGGTQTDDNTPGIIIGPVAPGETPKLFVDGKEVPSTYDPNTGRLTPNDPLPDGEHDFSYSLTDQAGNTSVPSDSIKINIDTTPPAKPPVPEDFFDNQGDIQGTFPGGTPTDDNTPGIIIGPVAPGETPKLFVDGKEVPSTYDPNTGRLTPNDPLPDGEHDFSYSLTDQAGNTSVPSDSIKINIDTTPPAKPPVPEDFFDNQGDIQGTFPGGTPTDDNTPGIIIGPVAPGETPKLFVDGKEVPSTYDPNTGRLTPNDPLPDGEHDFSYSLTDQAGNTSVPSDSIKINIDTTPPAKPPVPEDFFDNQGDTQGTFPGGTLTDDNTPGIIIGPVAPGETPKLFVDGKEVPSTYDPNTGRLTPNDPLPDGEHDFSYSLTDQAGNTSAPSDSIKINIDTTPPAKPPVPEDFFDNQGDIQGTFPGGTPTDDNTPGIIIGPVAPGETPKLFVDGKEVPSTYDPNTGRLTPNDPLPDGEHDFSYSLTDQAGNTSVPSDSIKINIDTTPPAKPPVPEDFFDNQGDIQGTFPGGTPTDDNTPGIIIGPVAPGETPKLFVDGKEVPSTYDPNTGRLTPNDPLPDGEHDFSYSLTDQAGNTSAPSDSIKINIDTTPPAKPPVPEDFFDNQGDTQGTFPGGTLTDDNTPGIIIGPVAPGETPKLFVDGKEVPSTYDPNTGRLTPNDPLPDGEHDFSYSLTDQAGNTSVPSDSIKINIDTTPPAKPPVPEDFFDNQGDIQGTFPGGTPTDDNTPGIIIGPVAPGETPKLFVDGKEVPSTYDPNTGRLTPNDPLPDGEHDFSYSLTDQAGNTSVPSDSIKINIDTTPPAKPPVPEDFFDNQGDIQGTFPGGTPTDDNTPGIIIGPVAPGETPKLFVDGKEVPSTYDPNTGRLTPNDPLPDGEHDFSYSLTDQAGNTSVPSDSIKINIDTSAPTQTTVITTVVDDVAPQTGNVANGGTTNDVTPELQGTISAVLGSGEVVAVYRDGVKVGTATVTGTSWTYSDAGLADGVNYVYTAQVEDAAGNQGSISNNYAISVDTTAPTQTTVITTVVDDVAPQTGNVANGGTTNDVTPELQGTISAVLGSGEVVAVYRDGVKVGTATVTGTSWTYSDAGLADGVNYVYTAQVEDAAGNQGSVSNNYAISVDTTAPTQTTVITTVVDDVAPQTGNVANGGTTNDVTPELQGTISAVLGSGEVVAVYRDGVKVGTATVTGTSWTYSDAGLADGVNYVYTAQVEDAAGNQGSVSNNYAISVDTTAPTQTTVITTVVDDVAPQTGNVANGGTTNDVTPELQGTISAVLGSGEVVAVYRDGVKVGTATVTGTSWTYSDAGLADGVNYVYTAQVEDAAGNQGSVSNNYAISVDTTAPTQTTVITTVVDDVAPQTGNVANGGTTNDVTPELQGTISAVLGSGEVVAVYRDGVKVGTATVTGTSWTYSDAGLADGVNYVYTAQVEDAAGNQGSVSNNYAISVDTTAPTQTTVITTVVDDVAPQTGNVGNGGTTNDVTPELQGTISAVLGSGEVVAVYRDGVKVGTATVTGTSWTYSDAGLADGVNYVYTAQVEDAAGNQGSVSNNYAISVDTTAPTQTTVITTVVDDVAPQTGNVANGGTTNDVTPELQGTISAVLGSGEVVAVYRDGVKVGTATVTGTSWTYSDAGLADGVNYVYTAQVEDAAGNQGSVSNNYAISVDTTAPTQTTVITTVVDDVAPQTGNVANGGTTNDVTPELQGTISAVLGSGEVVAVYRDGVKVGTATVTGTSWTYSDAGLADGVNYVYTAQVEDAAGNQGSVSNNYAISVDTTAPTQTTVITTVVDDVAPQTGNVANGGTTNDVTPELQGTISAVLGSGEVVAVYRDGVKVGTATVTGTSWTYSDAGLADGVNYVYTAQVEDAAGNQGSVSNNYAISVDTTAPTQTTVITTVVDDVAPQTGNVANGGTTNDVTPELQGTISAVLGSGEVVAVYRDGVKVGTATVTGTSWTYSDAGLADGVNYVYTAQVEDAAGNQGSVSNNYAISVDTTAPTQTTVITTVVDDVAPQTGNVGNGGTTNDVTPELQGTISAVLGSGEVVAVYRDGVKVGTATVTGTSWTYSDAGLADGVNYVYTAQVEDAAGNQGSVSNNYAISVDTTAPTQTTVITTVVDDVAPQTGNVANGGTTNDVTPELQGTISAVLGSGEVVAVYRDGVKVGTATVTGTSWTYSDAGLADGVNYVYTAQVEDAAGNQGSVSNNYAISVDTTAPTQTTVITTVVDDVAPQTGNVANGGTTNDVTPELQGTISAVLGSGEVVVVYRDGVKVGTATVTGTSWTYSDAGLADGVNYVYTAQVEDAAGNQGSVSNNYAISVDTTAPTQTTVITTVVDDVAPQTGNVANGGTTNDVTPELQGTISAVLGSGEVVAVYRDGVKVGTATVTGTSWTYSDAGLADGVNYVYTAQVEDAAGNQGSVSNNYAISVDTTAPTQTTVITTVVDDVAPQTGNVGNGGTTNDVTPELQGTISAVLGSGEVVVVYRDGVKVGTATVTGTSWTYSDAGLADGVNYVYTAQVEDAAGNQGSVSNNYAISVDTTAPTQTTVITTVVDDVAPQTGNVGNGGTTNDVTPELQGTISAVLGSGEVVAVYRDGVKVGTATVTGTSWTYSDAGLADGVNYVYTAQVEDAAGNQGSVSNNYAISVDTTAPTQTTVITTVVDDVAPQTGNVANGGTTNDVTPELQGTISAVLGSGEVVAVYRDGVKVGTATVTGTSWTYSDAGLADGVNYVYTAQVEDAAGNQGSISNNYAISVDTTAPTQTTVITTVVDDVAPQTGNVANGGTTNDVTPELQGTISAVLGSGEVVAVYRDGVKVGTATVTGTSWTYSDAGLADGVNYVYTAQVEDAAGNQGSVSNNYAISVDTTAPTQTTVITTVVDDVAPQTGNVGNGGTTNDVTPELQGTISAVLGSGEVVAVYRDGVKVGTATVTGTSWTYSDAGLADGVNYVYTAQVEDAAGNQGSVSNNYAISVDTTAPTQTTVITTVVDDVAPQTGNVANGGTTNDVTPELQGTISAVLGSGEVVAVYRDGVKVGTATVTGTSWTYSDAGLADGVNYVYTAQVEDAAGNQGSISNNYAISVDTTAPTQTTVITTVVDDVAPQTGNVANGGTTNDVTPELQGTISAVLGSGEVVAVYRDGVKVGTATVTGTSWTYSDAGLADGVNYVYTAQVEDAAGNQGSVSNNYTISVVTSAPTQTVTIDNYLDNVGTPEVKGSGTTTDDTTPTLTGSITSGVLSGYTINVYQNNVLVSSIVLTAGQTAWSYTPASVLNFGAYSYFVKLMDLAGNESTPTADFNLTVDTTATFTTLTTDTSAALNSGYTTNNDATNTDLVTRDSTPILNGSIERGLQANEQVTISLDGGSNWIVVQNNLGATTWSYTALAYTVSATVPLQVRVENTANGSHGTSTTTNYTVDLVAPVMSLTAPDLANAASIDSDGDKNILASNTLNFSSAIDGTAEVGSTVALIVDINGDGIYTEGVDRVISSTLIGAGGNWNMAVNLTSGSYHLGYVVWDAAGNRSLLSATTQFDIVNALGNAAAINTSFGTNPTTGYGSSMIINSSGNWSFLSDQAVYVGSSNNTYTTTVLTIGAGNASSYSFGDFNLDGNIDIVGADTAITFTAPIWTGTSSGGFTAGTTSAGTTVAQGGTVLIDMDGDGYLDAVIGDYGSDSASFLKNTNGSFTVYGRAAGSTSSNISTLAMDRENSGVDLNNDGKVDLALHVGISQSGNSNLFTLSLLLNNGTTSNTGANWTEAQVVDNVFRVSRGTGDSISPSSMTWADFNGDGYLDLYLNGTNTGTAANSKIFLNNNGTLATTGIAIAGDTLDGEASVAVDWNGDGKMDAIEVDYATGIANLYTNSGNVAAGWTTTQLADMANNSLNGVSAADYDWDGDIDLLASFTGSAATQLIANTNQVKDGTALHLRIVNAEGHNIYYGNTVQIFDSSGRLVSTQIINPQSGVWSNDGSAIVNVFGLSASETYTVKLLTNNNGTSTTYSWNVSTGAATDAQVLTTGGLTAANPTTLIGTGYNDTYVVYNVAGGTTTYNGGGGWSLPVLKGENKTWVATGGMDIVDFQNATNGINVNLQTGNVSGWGTLTTLSNVEGVRGSAQADILTGNNFDNIFEGRGGNDTIILGSNGGNDRLVYNLLNASDTATGGNGSDTVTGFSVGSLANAANTDADLIDLGGLLSKYTGTAYVYYDATTGVYTLDTASAGLRGYLQVSSNGTDTVISVDSTGSGNFTTPLLTLTGVNTTLETLLANGQLLIGSVTSLSVHINSQSTTDTTPIITGSLPIGLTTGEVLQVTVNGITYSSANSGTNAVVIDPLNKTWYIQVPTALSSGTYEVSAVVKDGTGGILMQDNSVNELQIVTNSTLLTPAWGNAASGNVIGGATVSLGQNGLWSFFQTSPTATVGTIYNSTGLNSYSSITLSGATGGISGASFADFNRDGYMDVFTNSRSGGSPQTVWTTTDGVNYISQSLASGTSMWEGAVVAYDKTGDGYLDFAYGDTGNDSMTFITNTAGTLSLLGGGAQGRPTGVTGNTFSEVSAVDLTNDGAVDVIQHTTSATTPTIGDAYTLTLLTNLQNSVTAFTQTNITGVFRTGVGGDPASATAMTWADFNNDGKMDLFLGAGRDAANTTDTAASRVYWNSGSGNLFGTASGNNGGQATYFSDTLAGGASVAVDWNNDGKMDIVELPRSVFNAVPNLYTNNGNGSFTQSTLGTTLTGIDGALAVDYNWDGAVDVLAYKGGANTILLQNTNTVADGTSIHLRILDANGLNVYYGNTVQLYNSAGILVSSQILNPQSGVFGADGSGLVNFYGLNANESYTAVLVKSANAISQDVGGLASLGGNTIENVNLSWTGLTAGAATQAYVLSAETSANVANGKFIGTGYNDIFFATAGTDTYDGSGGTLVDLSGNSKWSSTGGLDIVDYKLAGSTALTIDLSNTAAQNTGFGIASFKNIEGLAGSNGNDTFTGNTANNQFEGRGGNDTFNIGNGGQDTILYKVLLASDATGGNGSDTVNGFTVGVAEATPDADRIDLKALLTGYTADADGAAHYINGTATIDTGDTIANYLNVTQIGNNTVISIDRDGLVGGTNYTPLVTLNNVHTDLETLLANHQIVIG
ncbi:Ig-like domain-containing protein [Acinetobacter sp. CE-15]|uniref:Ig-like domain-containing protein n=1 Tax=Acinetobacter sp. CE-15 TaxID=3425693 RepID=UPI003DA41C91